MLAKRDGCALYRVAAFPAAASTNGPVLGCAGDPDRSGNISGRRLGSSTARGGIWDRLGGASCVGYPVGGSDVLLGQEEPEKRKASMECFGDKDRGGEGTRGAGRLMRIDPGLKSWAI